MVVALCQMMEERQCFEPFIRSPDRERANPDLPIRGDRRLAADRPPEVVVYRRHYRVQGKSDQVSVTRRDDGSGSMA